MTYVVGQTWLWLFLALALGALVGWLSAGSRDERWRYDGWLKWAAIAFTVGLVVAILKLIPGRGGFWLETALLSFVAYLIGCLIGDLLRGLARPPALDSMGARMHAGPGRAAAPQPKPVVPAPEPRPLPAVAAAAPIVEQALEKALEQPARAPAVADEDKYEGVRPEGFVAPSGGPADDLQRIRGVGPQNEARLHALGVWRFAQIAVWTPDNVRWVGAYLAFPGRIDREDWIAQAQRLAAGGEPEETRH